VGTYEVDPSNMKNRNRLFQKLSAQQNSVLPHQALRNSAVFQGRLFKRMPLSPLQRVGKLILAAFFLLIGAFFLVGLVSDFLSHSDIDFYGLIVGAVFIVVGFGLGMKMAIDAVSFPKGARGDSQRGHC
jgi:hypothetical protein